MASVYFFGDSICFGQYVSTDRVWTTRLARHLSEDEKFSHVLTQVTAVNGETSREALSRIHHCVTSHSPSVVWIQFGLNDSNYWESDRGAPRVSIDSYIANISEMIDRCVRFGTREVLVANNHTVTKRLAHEPQSNQYGDNAREYSLRLAELISDLDNPRVALVDTYTGMSQRFAQPSQYLLEDGVHLNEAGHEAYFSLALQPVLTALEGIV